MADDTTTDGDVSAKELAARAILDAISADDAAGLVSALNTFMGHDEPDADEAKPKGGLGLLLMGAAKPKKT